MISIQYWFQIDFSSFWLNSQRRELVDGTTKTIWSDGTQETRYPSGRLRVKDKDNNLIGELKIFSNQKNKKRQSWLIDLFMNIWSQVKK